MSEFLTSRGSSKFHLCPLSTTRSTSTCQKSSPLGAVLFSCFPPCVLLNQPGCFGLRIKENPTQRCLNCKGNISHFWFPDWRVHGSVNVRHWFKIRALVPFLFSFLGVIIIHLFFPSDWFLSCSHQMLHQFLVTPPYIIASKAREGLFSQMCQKCPSFTCNRGNEVRHTLWQNVHSHPRNGVWISLGQPMLWWQMTLKTPVLFFVQLAHRLLQNKWDFVCVLFVLGVRQKEHTFLGRINVARVENDGRTTCWLLKFPLGSGTYNFHPHFVGQRKPLPKPVVSRMGSKILP